MNASANTIVGSNSASGSTNGIRIGWWFSAAVTGMLIWAILFSLVGLLN
ncbi:hypothetical protein [Qipengyuania qiaonensis]|uniref:Uncharacterized protein n=1 Tax=Qipengyuania qiaonensis TaxID=2867240 RepID=A0ABS7J8I6_9SPHN|nr:hypothetical protein [Qipengyuania qiaonensis]MBX7483652.1 hypothetical protein [Qipengyuania qiaonensis]